MVKMVYPWCRLTPGCFLMRADLCVTSRTTTSSSTLSAVASPHGVSHKGRGLPGSREPIHHLSSASTPKKKGSPASCSAKQTAAKSVVSFWLPLLHSFVGHESGPVVTTISFSRTPKLQNMEFPILGSQATAVHTTTGNVGGRRPVFFWQAGRTCVQLPQQSCKQLKQSGRILLCITFHFLQKLGCSILTPLGGAPPDRGYRAQS